MTNMHHKMRIGERQLYSWLFFFMLLMTFTACLVGLLPISLNRIIVPIIVIILVILMLKSKVQPFEIVILLSLVISSVYSMIITDNFSENFNYLVYYLVGTVWLLFIANDNRRLQLRATIIKSKRMIRFFVAILMIFILVTIFMDECWTVSWGGERYYAGFDNPHSMAENACAVQLLLLILSLIRRNNLFIVFAMAVCAYATFATGARTFIVPVLVVLYLYVRYNVRNKQYRILIYAVGIVGVVVMLLHSSIATKFSFVTSVNTSDNIYGWSNPIEALTSGRTIIWSYDILAFNRGTLIQKLLGRGFNSIYEINVVFKHDGGLWAHNDFINLLVVGGILSALTYSSAFILLFVNTFKHYSKMNRILIIMYSIFPAFVNGFYMYQNLVISFMMLYCLIDQLELSKD